MQPNAMLALRLRANKRERPPGFGKIAQNGQTEPKQSLGLPEGDVFFSFYIAEHKTGDHIGSPLRYIIEGEKA